MWRPSQLAYPLGGIATCGVHVDSGHRRVISSGNLSVHL